MKTFLNLKSLFIACSLLLTPAAFPHQSVQSPYSLTFLPYRYRVPVYIIDKDARPRYYRPYSYAYRAIDDPADPGGIRYYQLHYEPEFAPPPSAPNLAADIQFALRSRGYYRGNIDGNVGQSTRNAIRAFKSEYGIPANGLIDLPLLNALNLD